MGFFVNICLPKARRNNISVALLCVCLVRVLFMLPVLTFFEDKNGKP